MLKHKPFSVTKSNLPVLISKLQDLLEFNPDTNWQVLIKERKSIRSLPANNLYWEFVTQFANYFGYDKDFSHDLLRYKFLYDVVNFDGEEAKQLKSTAKLNTAQMAEYFDACIRYASEHGFMFEIQV